MSRSPMRTVPVTRAIGLVSCMRFRQRTNVLFPQPDGPIRAVAWLGEMLRLMSCSVWFDPYHAFRFLTSMPTPTCALLLATLSSQFSIQTTGFARSLRTVNNKRFSTRPFQHAAAGYVTNQGDRQHDQDNQNQRAGPRHAMPVIVRRQGKQIDPQGKG